jgi:hypothetical protein
MSAVAQRQAGVASGINNAVARTAGLLAIAVFGVLVTMTFDRVLETRLDALANLPASARVEVEAQRNALAAIQPPEGLDSGTAAAITAAIDAAFVAGFRVAMIVGAVMALLSALVAWRMVEGKEAPGAPDPAPAPG